MSDQQRFTGSGSPGMEKNEKNIRSKSRLLRQTRPIYLTDGQISSDHTNISSSEKTILKMEYETKLRRLEKENGELRELVVSLKASQYYELDEEKIRGIIRENDSLKGKIAELEGDIKTLDEELSRSMVENEYLKRNNQALKQDLQKLVKESVKEKHNYYALPLKKPTIYTSYTPGQESIEVSEIKNEGRDKDKQKEREKEKLQKMERISRLFEKKKVNQGQANIQAQTHREKDKMDKFDKLEKLLNQGSQSKDKYRATIIAQNQQSIQSIQEKSTKKSFTNTNAQGNSNTNSNGNSTSNKHKSKSRYRSSSKSGEKLLINSIMSSKMLTKRSATKKELIELPSTAQSTSGISSSQNLHVKHYKSSGNILLKPQEKSRELLQGQIQSQQQATISTSRSTNSNNNIYESSGSGNQMGRRKNDQATVGDYNEQYYIAKSREQRQQGTKKKKSIYYNI